MSQTKTKLRVALISTINTHCGIATYTENLFRELVKCPDLEVQVWAEVLRNQDLDTGVLKDNQYVRCWSRDWLKYDKLIDLVYTFKPNIIHVQHENGLFLNPKRLDEFVQRCRSMGIKVVGTIHCVTSRNMFIFDADSIIVHTLEGFEQLNLSHRANAMVIPHGTEIKPIMDKELARHWLKYNRQINIEPDDIVFCSIGFVCKPKNIELNCRVLSSYRDQSHNKKIKYMVIGKWVDKDIMHTAFREAMKRTDSDSWLFFIDAFIPEGEMPYYYCATDYAIMNYTRSFYSASGAFRLMATYRVPSVVSEAVIFSDINQELALKCKIDNADSLLKQIESLVELPGYAKKFRTNLKNFAELTSWETVGKKHVWLYKELMEGKKK
jgi:hypothetical protein